MDVNNYEADEVWKPQFIQRDISLVSMHQYRISFTIQSSVDRLIMVRLQANDYSTMLIEKTISLSSNMPYTFEEDITVLNTTNYLFGFMLGRINNQVLESVHTITISNPSIKEVYKKDSETPDSPIKNRSLAWSDEFNGTSIDNTKWSYEIGIGSWGWGNNEQQYYTNSQDNSYVSDGTLKIVARKETMHSSNYTSARMITKNKYSFKYGYVEARIALPSSMGIWPAFWMLGTNIDQVGWPACGEIDFMEAVNNNNTVYSTIHYKNATGHEEYGRSFNVTDRTSFHTYGFEWTETKLLGYVDNIKIFETNNDGCKANSFNNEFYILLNVAVGGQWPGYNIADNFPQVMTVDYVRVYQ
ncbi:MAG: glycoside hydrolase family 16 protein [Erysipelotrichales bacterium]|nr:glycoside hydrolase family 16 protein [Erysipelotrichales bacterium]